ncbi:GNAT family N-acetyltransferase [Aquibacillus kalidii]|uniref:GNAT family N-acetyltransferase n=1 Tax=Aquibacillus kalidii TaxID=2762597 RepID=UPI001648E4DB|nr:GNAT family N-acetyltransferase [Aquibacillus kalidii]
MDPLLLNIPTQLETNRLILRAPSASGDGKIVNEAIVDSINELKLWLPFAQTLPSVEETERSARIAYINYLKRESFRYLIFHKETEDFIGITSYETVDWDIPKSEIGYWIATKFSGNGYMTEAIEKLTQFGLKQLGFKRIEIRCDPENSKSRSIPQRLGYDLEGILKNDDKSADDRELRDTCIYAIIQKRGT